MKLVPRVLSVIHFLIACVFASTAYSQTSYPKPDSYVVDQAGILTADDKKFIEQWAYELQSKTTAHLEVFIVQSIGDEPIENVAVNVFKQWGIGDKKKDNGVLLLIAVKERQLRIEVGYGLEGVLTDYQSNHCACL